MVQGAVTWVLDDLERLQAEGFSVEGEPRVSPCPFGRAVVFSGDRDSLWLETNPLAGLTVFTVEVVFRPDPGGLTEQRFLHLGQPDGDRLLFETRLVGADSWYLDTFILSGTADSTLLNRRFPHPTGAWYHLAAVWDGHRHANFVDGRLEQEAPFDYRPATGGRTSIGVRLNRVCWFRGAIHRIQITPEALDPERFTRPGPT